MDLVEAGDFDAAKDVYELGAFSKSAATITLTKGLPFDLAKGVELRGVTYTGTSTQRQSSGYDVVVITLEEYTATNSTLDIQVKYHTEGCFVGANPQPVWDGCKWRLVDSLIMYSTKALTLYLLLGSNRILLGLAPEGILSVPTVDDSAALEYIYDPPTTYNNYNIKYFTAPTEYIFEEGGSYPELYQKFVTYYGSDSFYDDWIQTAFAGGKTSFSNGNADFSSYSNEARAGK
jgi:hypothetical protein